MKRTRMKNALAKRAKVQFFHFICIFKNMQIWNVLVSCRCHSNSQSHGKRRSHKNAPARVPVLTVYRT